jgi:hypothetical protein
MSALGQQPRAVELCYSDDLVQGSNIIVWGRVDIRPTL